MNIYIYIYILYIVYISCVYINICIVYIYIYIIYIIYIYIEHIPAISQAAGKLRGKEFKFLNTAAGAAAEPGHEGSGPVPGGSLGHHHRKTIGKP